MTDSRLQELKRAWKASGSVEDEAAYLRERVRVGDLTQERLELAAYCRHEAALRVLCQHVMPPRPKPTPLESEHDHGFSEWQKELRSFLRGLVHWGPKPLVLGGLLAVSTLLQGNYEGPGATGLKLLRTWLETPTTDATNQVRRFLAEHADTPDQGVLLTALMLSHVVDASCGSEDLPVEAVVRAVLRTSHSAPMSLGDSILGNLERAISELAVHDSLVSVDWPTKHS